MSEDQRAYRAAALEMAQSGTADLDTLARVAVDAAGPFIRAEELDRYISAAQKLDATYPAERDPAPEQRRASTRPDLDAAFRYPFSEYLEDTYDCGGCDVDVSLSRHALADIAAVDNWLDSDMSPDYAAQPLAHTWARVTKVAEEAGEVWRALSNLTGENPRKGTCGTEDELLEELADTACAALFAIQHITKDALRTHDTFANSLNKAMARLPVFERR